MFGSIRPSSTEPEMETAEKPTQDIQNDTTESVDPQTTRSMNTESTRRMKRTEFDTTQLLPFLSSMNQYMDVSSHADAAIRQGHFFLGDKYYIPGPFISGLFRTLLVPLEKRKHKKQKQDNPKDKKKQSYIPTSAEQLLSLSPLLIELFHRMVELYGTWPFRTALGSDGVHFISDINDSEDDWDDEVKGIGLTHTLRLCYQALIDYPQDTIGHQIATMMLDFLIPLLSMDVELPSAIIPPSTSSSTDTSTRSRTSTMVDPMTRPIVATLFQKTNFKSLSHLLDIAIKSQHKDVSLLMRTLYIYATSISESKFIDLLATSFSNLAIHTYISLLTELVSLSPDLVVSLCETLLRSYSYKLPTNSTSASWLLDRPMNLDKIVKLYVYATPKNVGIVEIRGKKVYPKRGKQESESESIGGDSNTNMDMDVDEEASMEVETKKPRKSKLKRKNQSSSASSITTSSDSDPPPTPIQNIVQLLSTQWALLVAFTATQSSMKEEDKSSLLNAVLELEQHFAMYDNLLTDKEVYRKRRWMERIQMVV